MTGGSGAFNRDEVGRHVPWLCRVLGHRYRYVMTDSFWHVVVHRCARCGSQPHA